MGDENHVCTLGDYSRPSHEGYRNTIELPEGNNVCEINRAAGGKLRNKNADESWEIIENLALYDHEARVRDYMAAHTERMERFENTIFKQREEINGLMTEMFGLLKELTTRRTPEKVIIREDDKFPVTKNLNSISLTKEEEGGSDRTKVTPGNAEKPTETKTETPIMEVEKINEVANRTKLTNTS
ncbi:hypothetical protein Tco_0683774 [Tanacetum coccineum]